MATKNEFYGKYNWETWATGLWIDNDEGLYNMVNHIVATNSDYKAEQLLKDLLEEELNPIVDAALSEIYWPEIINAIRDESEEMIAV